MSIMMKRCQQRALGVLTTLRSQVPTRSPCSRYNNGTSFLKCLESNVSNSNHVRSIYSASMLLSGPKVFKKLTVDVGTGDVGTAGDHESASSSTPPAVRRTAVEETQVEVGLDARISQATDKESLLKLLDTTGMGLKQYCQIVGNLGSSLQHASAKEKKAVLIDPRFIAACSILQKGHYSNVSQYILIALQGLYAMDVPMESEVIQTLENELKWLVRRCPVRTIAKAIAVLSDQGKKLKATPKSTKLQSSHPLVISTEHLQKRWVEVVTGTDFISTFQVISLLDNEIRLKLEDRAVELVQEFTPMEMIKIFIALGSQKRRPTPLLRTLAFHLYKSKDIFDVRDLIDMLYAFSQLAFADPVLTAKVCEDLSLSVNTITNPALISALTTSLGHLRYKHKNLLAALDDWIIKNLDVLRPFDFASWLITASVLNHQSANMEKFCARARSVLVNDDEVRKSPARLLNVVYSLAILKQVDASLLSSVLDPTFVNLIDSAKSNNPGAKLRLLNLNAVSKVVPGYKGPSLSEDLIQKWTVLSSSSDENLSKCVLESLGNFLPPPKYLKPGEKLRSGVHVDAFCKVDANLDPVPVTTEAGNNAKVTEVAVVSHGYSTHTIGVREPTGTTALQTRLLENDGFKVLPVPYMEFSPQDKLLRRVQYLEQKLRGKPDST